MPAPDALPPVRIDLPDGRGYEVLVGRGIGEALEGALAGSTGSLVVTDANVAAALTGSLPVGPRHVLTPGEADKTPAAMVAIVRAAAAAGLDRASAIVAVGGGVTGDLAGLAAALFMRGIDWVNAPTSLLAMVDAAIGGKTGVDLPEGKNLLGAFHQPRAVIADIDRLATLPDAEWRHGLAEVIKAGLIADPDLLVRLEGTTLPALQADPAVTAAIVHRAVQIKAAVVMRDEREAGERMKLNAGHTLGHALEAASAYALPHGQAVAIGLVLEARLAQHRGLPVGDAFIERLTTLFARYDLPTASDPAHAAAAMDHIDADKKKFAGALRFALPVAPGDVRIVTGIPRDAVAAVLSDGRQ